MRPSVIVLAGPNGAGKTTAAPEILRDVLQVSDFVNADVIAQGLSFFSPESAAIEAGRIMLARLYDLAEARASFAFETTLASRSFSPWLSSLLREGYLFHLFYFWLPSPEMAIARVGQRVRMGGHFVPEETVRRRYHRGIQYFFRLYMPIATTWAMYDNGDRRGKRLIASGSGTMTHELQQNELWQKLRATYDSSTSS